ncbi:TetR/AcrR family transcriptional regulator [Gluconacetobacter sacchari]|nr:TetR/AcrR family transcriptional regulator [Gluconacetobacter sacchari]
MFDHTPDATGNCMTRNERGAAGESSADNLEDMPPKALVVLRAARTVFLAHGFSMATTDMIQREAGVSKSTVYAHYPNKEALFVAVIEAECAAHASKVRAISSQKGNLRAGLAAIARAYLRIVLSTDALSLFRVVVAEAPSFPNLARVFFLAGPHVIEGVVSLHLAEAIEAGEVDLSEIGRDAAAAQFTNLVRGEPQIQCLTHPHATPSEAQVDQWASNAVTTFWKAYGIA